MALFDLTYATIDSLSEGVGSSQIAPLMEKLSSQDIKISLITFEKNRPTEFLVERMKAAKVNWVMLPFGNTGVVGGIERTMKLAKMMPDSLITHARSDFPAVAARISNQKNILWDVRSLWAEQRKFIETNLWKRSVLSAYEPFESLACRSASSISTLTKAIVPVLENRHKNLPILRAVVPTAVDLDRFRFSPKMPKKIRGLYSGTYNRYYDLELSKQFIQTLNEIVECEVDWAKPSESTLDRLNSGEKSIFTATQPQMAEIMSAYSFGISICKEEAGLSLKASMPTKIAEFLAIGRPVVVNAGLGDCDEILGENGVGIVIRKGDDLKAKAKELIALCENSDTPEKCRETATKYFDLDTGVEKYLSLYRGMIG
jgi:glycosyltransferase involved in cell wall biosynthesis